MIANGYQGRLLRRAAGCALLLSCLRPSGAQAQLASPRITVSNVIAARGDTATVTVTVDGAAQGIAGFSAECEWPQALAAYLDAEAGPMIAGPRPAFTANFAPFTALDGTLTGRLDMDGEGELPTNGPGRLCSFHIRISATAAPGNYPIRLTFWQIRDNINSILPSTAADGTLTVLGVPGSGGSVQLTLSPPAPNPVNPGQIVAFFLDADRPLAGPPAAVVGMDTAAVEAAPPGQTQHYEVLYPVPDTQPPGDLTLLLSAMDPAGNAGTTQATFTVNSGSLFAVRAYRENPVDTPSLSTFQFDPRQMDDSGGLSGPWGQVMRFTGWSPTGDPLGVADVHEPGTFDFRFDPVASPDQFSEASAAFHVDQVDQYFVNTLGVTDVPLATQVFVHAGMDGPREDIPAYLLPGRRMVLGQLPPSLSPTSQELDYALDAGVIDHEFTHGVIATLAPHLAATLADPTCEGSAIVEGFCDYFSASLRSDPNLSSYALGGTQGTPFRNLSVPRYYPQDVAQATTDASGLAVQTYPESHFAGRIWGSALWALRGSVGASVADRLAVQTIRGLQNTGTITFCQALAQLDAADQALYKGSHVSTINQLFAAQGVTPADSPTSPPPFTYVQPSSAPPPIQLESPFLAAYVPGREYRLGFTVDAAAGGADLSLIPTTGGDPVATTTTTPTVENVNGQDRQRFQCDFRLSPNAAPGTYRLVVILRDMSGVPMGDTLTLTSSAQVVPAPPGGGSLTDTPTVIAIRPAQAIAFPGGQRQFTVVVLGDLPDAAELVVLGDAASSGTIAPDGTYQAPATITQKTTVSIVLRIGGKEVAQAQVILTPPSGLPRSGDVDGDGKVTINDVLEILRAALQLVDLTPEQTAAADVDGSGKVSVVDAVLALRRAIGLI